jgi:Secretion system C-terminal sorting domain
MKKIFLLLLTTCLFLVQIFAAPVVTTTKKNTKPFFDAVGPVISYALLSQSSCVTTRSFTATITDIDGVNTTPGTRPRVYYRRTGDLDGYFDNTSATNGWKYAEATNVASTFTFVIDYSLLNGGVVSGNTIQYFVVAQDLAATPNVGSGGTTFATPPTSVALTTPNFPAVGINLYNIVNALPTYIQVGALGDFNTLTAASGLFSSINNIGLSGNTIIEIIDPLITETNAFPLYQIQNTGCGAGAVNLLIKPATGVSPVLTGSRSNEPIIRILSSNVTIDGSNNGTTSRDLTLINTNTTGPSVILFGSLSTVPTNNSTLKNTVCRNTVNLTSCVVVSDGSVGGNPGYFNNITIQNNSIQKSSIGLICSAVPLTGNGSVLITGNDLNFTGSNQIGALGIYTDGVDGAVITNNNIGNFETAITTPRYGIHVNTNTINSTVLNNTITAINYTGTSASTATYGINITTAVAASNNNVISNTINNVSANGTSTAFGINIATATGGITLQNNKISNIKHTNAAGYGAYGIGLFSTSTAANITVANNFIFDIAGFGQATLARNGHGIYMGTGGGYKIYYNSINLNTNQSAGVTASIMIANTVTTAASLDIRDNILVNTQTAGALAGSRYAIYSANTNNAIFSAIDNNIYYTSGTNLGFISGVRAALTDIQAGFGSNLNSFNILPNFVSATDLHLTTANCGIDNRGTPVSVTTDIDVAARDITTPDIGADEFTAALSGTLAGIAATAVCDNKIVSASGTNYVTNACDLIARVVPSGGSQVAGVINTCVTLDAAQQYFNGEPYVQRHYDIEPVTTPATATATVTLYFTNQEFVNYNTINSGTWPLLPTNGVGNTVPNRNNVRVTQFHGTPTGGLPTTTPGNYTGTRVLITPGAANVFWNGTYWEVTIPVTGFSGFYLHTTLYNAPLPVNINYLTGRRQGTAHLLNWKVTCNSSPRATMILQRSADSRIFNDLNSITADAARCQQPFDYTDADPLKGMNYYRLKVLDADGHISYSTTVALLNAVNGFDIISMAPNPVVNDNFKLNIASAKAGKLEVIIFDMQGRLVSRQSIALIAGFNSLPVNVSNFASGTYTMRVGMSTEELKVMRFVKQ